MGSALDSGSAVSLMSGKYGSFHFTSNQPRAGSRLLRQPE